MLSKCTIVRATSRAAYKLEAMEWLAIWTETMLNAILKRHNRKDCIPCPQNFILKGTTEPHHNINNYMLSAS